MFFGADVRNDIKEVKSTVSCLARKVDDMHKVVFVDPDGLQTRLTRAEDCAGTAIQIARSRTAAMWTVMAFALLAIGGVLGYQMYRIDLLAKISQGAVDANKLAFNPFGMFLSM